MRTLPEVWKEFLELQIEHTALLSALPWLDVDYRQQDKLRQNQGRLVELKDEILEIMTATGAVPSVT